MSLPAPAPPRPAADAWRPRRPEATVLYRTVSGHLADFLAAAEPADGRPGLPGFVRRG